MWTKSLVTGPVLRETLDTLLKGLFLCLLPQPGTSTNLFPLTAAAMSPPPDGVELPANHAPAALCPHTRG